MDAIEFEAFKKRIESGENFEELERDLNKLIAKGDDDALFLSTRFSAGADNYDELTEDEQCQLCNQWEQRSLEILEELAERLHPNAMAELGLILFYERSEDSERARGKALIYAAALLGARVAVEWAAKDLEWGSGIHGLIKAFNCEDHTKDF